MGSFWKLSVLAIALLMFSGLVAGLGTLGGASAHVAAPSACTGAPAITIQSQRVQGSNANVTGFATAGPGAGCTVFQVQIAWGDGTNGPTQYYGTYQANFSFVHTYFTTGTFTVTVTARDTTGPSSTAQTILSIHGPPYYVTVNFDQNYHLPGDRATLYIDVFNSTTNSLQGGYASLTFFVTTCYDQQTNQGACTPVTTINTHPQASNATAISFTVPPDAVADSQLSVQVEANATLPTGLYSENSLVTNLWISTPQTPYLCVGSTEGVISFPCPTTTVIQPGQNFVLTIDATVSYSSGSAPWSGGAVLVTFYLNNQAVSPTFPKSMVTNSSGIAQGIVQTTGLGTGDLNITAAVSDPANAAVVAVHSTVFITIAASPAAQVQVTIGSAGYYGGDTMTSSFAVTSFTGHAVSGWSANSYFITGNPGTLTTLGSCAYTSTSIFFAQGPLTGTSGSVPSFVIPSSFSGAIEVTVLANNATTSTPGVACTLVSPPKLLVQPSEVVYHPGDSIGVSFTPEGQVFNSASYFASVSGVGISGNTVIIYNQSLGSSTSFSFTIPSTGTLPSYTLTVLAQNSSGVIAGQDLRLNESSGYALVVSVQTPSQYTDGSYQPGQSVTFTYTLASLGLATPPKFFSLNAGFLNTQQGETVVQETATSGSITLRVPSSAGQGISLVAFKAGVPTAFGTFGVGTQVALLVNPSPSALNYEIGAGSGFSVSDILVIVIIVVLAIIVFLVWRRRHGEPRVPKPHRKRSGHSEPESAQSGVTQWQQQPGSEGQFPAQEGQPAPASEQGQPPMPESTYQNPPPA